MKKLIILFYLISFTLYGYSQFMETDTLKDLSNYKVSIEKSFELLDLIKETNVKEIEKNIYSEWGNKRLFKSLIREVSDSLSRYGIPSEDRIIAMIDRITIEGVNEQYDYLRLKFLINTDKFIEEKSYSITFIFEKDLGFEKVNDFQVEAPINMDELLKEFK